MAGIFGEFLLVSVSHKTKHENDSEHFGKIQSEIRGKMRDQNAKNSGKLSFCNFSDLTNMGSQVTFESMLGYFGVGLSESLLSHFWVTLILCLCLARSTLTSDKSKPSTWWCGLSSSDSKRPAPSIFCLRASCGEVACMQCLGNEN